VSLYSIAAPEIFMKKPDQSHRFLFEDHPIRGQYVTLDKSWQEIAQQAGLEGRGLTLLGEAVAAVTLLADTLKIEGSVTLQIRGTGPLGLLVVEANSKQKIRGIARQSSQIEEPMDLQEIFGSDHLVITIKTNGAEPYQGIAPLRGSNFSDALEYYFDTSEQLATQFWLACDGQNASGMLIQKIPGRTKDDDAWNRVIHLASTVTEEELKTNSLADLLHKLFHEEAVRLFDSRDVGFSCSCSRERTAAMLLTLGKAEADDIVEKEGAVSVICEFCNASYNFDVIDVEQIFSEGRAVTLSETTH
jgi:molecular chaperone Hsp33